MSPGTWQNQASTFCEWKGLASYVDVVVGDHLRFELTDRVFGVLLQYPATDGRVFDYEDFAARARALDVFGLERCIDGYHLLYHRLAAGARKGPAPASTG